MRTLPLTTVVVFLIVGCTALSLYSTDTPYAYAIDEGGTGGSTGGDSGSTGGGSTETGGAHGGARRGHSTNVSRIVIRFLAQIHQIGTQYNIEPRWHPYSTPFVENETKFLCSLQRYFSRLEPSAMNHLVLEDLASLMNRDKAIIARFLRNPKSCKQSRILR